MGQCFGCCKGGRGSGKLKLQRSEEFKTREELMAENAKHVVHQALDKEDFEYQLVEAGSKLVIVDFFATWCGPCKNISPKCESLAGTMKDKVVFLKVDVDHLEDVSREQKIAAVPTFVAFRSGHRIGSSLGATIEKVKNFIIEMTQKSEETQQQQVEDDVAETTEEKA